MLAYDLSGAIAPDSPVIPVTGTAVTIKVLVAVVVFAVSYYVPGLYVAEFPGEARPFFAAEQLRIVAGAAGDVGVEDEGGVVASPVGGGAGIVVSAATGDSYG